MYLFADTDAWFWTLEFFKVFCGFIAALPIPAVMAYLHSRNRAQQQPQVKVLEAQAIETNKELTSTRKERADLLVYLDKIIKRQDRLAEIQENAIRTIQHKYEKKAIAEAELLVKNAILLTQLNELRNRDDENANTIG